jgi:hypothetical protein
MGACSVAHAAELDRATALSLIRNTGLEPYTFEVPIGNEVNLQILLPTVVRQDATWGNQLNVAYKCLNDLGYLTITKNPRHPLGAYIVATTNKSGTAGKVLNTLLLGYASKYVFQLADRIPERISGIKKTGMDSATVLFEWKLGNHSELYKCMFIPEDTLTTGVAGLAKYDNGWRVENVDLFKK